MAYELKSARYLAAEILLEALREGDTAVDATLGNGHDTELLCRLVGPAGRVYCFDMQQEAVESTARRLEAAGLRDRAVLFRLGHEHMKEQVPAPVDAVVFNLGWLPGGDHGITTRVETTLSAIRQALTLLRPQGVLLVCVYPGHPEGQREKEAVLQLLSSLSPRDFNVLSQEFLNAGPGAPLCFVAQKQRTGTAP